ncbi:MAG: MBL fold metallo-hydrolase [Candidatus Shapirobacteria bacterium]
MLNYRRLIVGELGTNCYLVWSNDKTAVIIDPGDEGVEIAQIVAELGLQPMVILLTHGHFDHILGVLDLQLIFKIPVAMGKEDAFLVNRAKETAEYFLKKKIKAPKIKLMNIENNNIKNLKVGDETIKIIKTPGHTPGSVCFYAQDSGLLFTGDTIFANGVGETDHQYSSKPNLDKSIKKIFSLKNNITVLPGHGEEISLILLKKLFLQNFVDYLA